MQRSDLKRTRGAIEKRELVPFALEEKLELGWRIEEIAKASRYSMQHSRLHERSGELFL